MQDSTITAKGQTTLPRQVRAALGVGPGDKVRYLIPDGGEVRILPERPVATLAGCLAQDDPVRSSEEIEAAAAPPAI